MTNSRADHPNERALDRTQPQERIRRNFATDPRPRSIETRRGRRVRTIVAGCTSILAVVVAVGLITRDDSSTPATTNHVSYRSNCIARCFTSLDPVSCDRTFHFDFTLLGDVARLEGTTAVITTVGPGLQPTYEVKVAGGSVVLDAVAYGTAYAANPSAGCGTNAHWTGLLTSVDGLPTVTPDPPT